MNRTKALVLRADPMELAPRLLSEDEQRLADEWRRYAHQNFESIDAALQEVLQTDGHRP